MERTEGLGGPGVSPQYLSVSLRTISRVLDITLKAHCHPQDWISVLSQRSVCCCRIDYHALSSLRKPS